MAMSSHRAAWQILLRRPVVAARSVAGGFSHGRRITSAASAAPLPSSSPSPPPPSLPDSAPDASLPGGALPGTEARRSKVSNARPFSDFLTDTFQRQHDYLRISVTERCNLRCLYCMPEEGVELSPARELLTTPEIVMLANVFVSQGVRKIRLTGGEPTVRRDILPLMRQLGALRTLGLRELCLTTNGIALHRKLEAMVEAGLTGVNLSLDTLDAHQFLLMTRRDGYKAVRRSMDRILALNAAGAGVRLKINCVVMRGRNENELGDFVALTRDHDLEVRFIEYMPFDGNRWSTGKMVSFNEMLERISQRFPTLRRTTPDGHHNGPNDTSKTYEVPGFAGRVGFITSMTHNFCGGCNRLRITSDGSLKVCLFGNAEVSLRDILRRANGNEPIDEAAFSEMTRLAKEAAAVDGAQGSAMEIPLDGVLPNASELLEVIGMAVKRKKERHAGLGKLEHMKNRPMILIEPHRHEQHDTGGIRLVSPWAKMPRSWPKGQLMHSPSTMLLSGHRAYYSTRRGGAASTLEQGTEDKHSQKTTATVQTDTATDEDDTVRLTHVSASGTAHMVSVADKAVTARTAAAACTVRFSNPVAAALVRANEMAKGDVLGVARIAGIMAAKRTADLIPLCHPLALSQVRVELDVAEGGGGGGGTASAAGSAPSGHVAIRATVRCEGKTGVEMEALTAASVAALTVYDMCKAVDKGMQIDGLRVVLKEGGKSGRWEEGRPAGDGAA